MAGLSGASARAASVKIGDNSNLTVGALIQPRYESARLTLSRPCIAGEPTKLSLLYLPGTEGDVELTLVPLTLET